jgi:hypothetical protein
LDSYIIRINNLSNDYGIMDSVDSHVVSNLEWGAVLYLSHSKYGVCSSGKCDGISVNSSYVSEKDKQDTTTRNVYGVYDMAGGTAEYVVGDALIGSAVSEVRVSEYETWYRGSYATYNDYLVRGGFERGMFTTSGIGMFDVTTRSVLTSK